MATVVDRGHENDGPESASSADPVWVIDPRKRAARVFSTPENSTLVRADQALDGGAVLPGFVVPLSDLLDRGRRPWQG